MSSADFWLLLTAAACVVLAGVFSAADAALASFSRARAQELVAEGRAGARRLLDVLDDAPRYLNTALLMRLLCEIAAIVIVTQLVRDAYDGAFWPSLATSIGVMTLVSFVVVGVAPRTLGRQHSQRVALATAGPISWVTSILGPIPRLLILLGNAITPGRGFREGPFSTETELRELVDLAEASAVIESGDRKLIHSVFEFGDTIVREVMVPRGDVVYIERFKNLRQTMSLFLRSGFSRVPVVDENLDDVVGIAYLKDIVRRDFEAPDVEFTQRIDEVIRPAFFVPGHQARGHAALGDAGQPAAHRGRRGRVRRDGRPGHHRGPAGGDRRRDHRRVRPRARRRRAPLRRRRARLVALPDRRPRRALRRRRRGGGRRLRARA